MSSVMARQSTSVILDVGPILDSTGAEYASAVIGDLTISKNGTRAAMSGNTFNYAANGMYSLTLTTSNTDTLGVIQISCNKSTYQMRVVERQVVPAMIYDSIVLGTDVLQSDVTQFGGTAGTFAAGIPTAALDSASVTAVQSGLALEATSQSIKGKTDNLPSDPADQSLIITATDAVMTRLGAPAGASIAADIAAIDGGGGGDATLAKQEEILLAVDSVADTVAAYAARMALEVQLRGFPNVICRNADYLVATESEIRITVEDLTGTAITEIAGTPVASLSWLFGMGTEQDPALIAGTCTWDGDSDELVIEIAKAATAGKQTGSLTWQIGVSIGAARRWLGGGTTRLIERQF